MRRRHSLALGAALALAAAAPAAAAEVRVNTDETNLAAPTWAPQEVTAAPGDTIVWSFAGTRDQHNVVSDSGNWSHSTAVAFNAPDSSVTFTAAGRYRFVCQAHSGSMWGYVNVGDVPPPPPPPPGSLPLLNDSAPPTVFETGGLDREAPSVRSVRVRRAANGARRIRFRVSERVDLTLRFKRGRKTVMTKRASAAGTYRVTVRSSRKLRAGRYRVEIRARDLAGNPSRPRTARLTLR